MPEPGVDGESLALILAGVRRLVDEVLIPAEAETDASGAIPARVVRHIREIGLFGLTVPQEYGGLGLSLAQEVAVVFELCRASPSFRSLIGTTVSAGGKALMIDGTADQKRRHLPGIARGETIVSFCLTEPGSGSDAAGLSTAARRDGDFWVLNGTKRFISNAPHAGLFIVMARSETDSTGARGVSAFLVEAGTPGVQVQPAWNKMGQKGAAVADVVFEDARIPADALLGGREGQGFRTAMKSLDAGRIHIAAVAVGLATRLVEEAIAHAREREQFGEPLAGFQLIQGMLADSEADRLAARALVEAAARRADAGEDVRREAAAAKLFATEACWRIADRAVQIHGGYGYMRDYAVERLFRDARLLRLFEGTSQIMQVVIARDMVA
ncbi:MAG: acyl-CoA dehydrogenase family protein [Alphaproteobacteria bacterium]|nr:acyl-CoA dehydrogenase family protein [Alphaproteobacteria bacterium]MCB9931190.1 acyl-CoA dehydrogenase family protein [Alphaproteobacteria bacterium]